MLLALTFITIVQLAATLGHVANRVAVDSTVPSDRIMFVAWEDSDLLSQNVFMALGANADSKCTAGPLSVVVRISTCFTIAEAQAIDSWVNTSLASSSPSYYLNGNAITADYYVRFADTTAQCPTGAIKAAALPWSQYLQFLKPEQSTISNPHAIISFTKDNIAMTAVAGTNAFQLQFRLCSTTCASLATDSILTKLTDLISIAPVSATRYFPCSLSTPGAVGLSYKDATGTLQCVCACPTGTTVSSTACVASSSARAALCPWSANTAGYKCSWTRTGISALKLSSDCAVAVPVPKDNYVSDGRTNKNDSLSPITDPKISVTSKKGGVVSTSVAQSWKNYILQPATEMDKITLGAFGIYNLTITASDYLGQASCDGCVAVVDAYPPHTTQTCSTATWGSSETSPADITVTSLQTAIDKEASFNMFSNDSVVVNNLASERADIRNRTMRDWFGTAYSVLPNDTASCFHDFILRDLLSLSSSTTSVLQMDSVALSNLQCSRCCSKQTTLREYYYDYKCTVDPALTEKKIQGDESCSFKHCMRIAATALVDVDAAIRADVDAVSLTVLRAATNSTTATLDGMTIHRSLPCTNFTSGCSFKATLSNLFVLQTTWRQDQLPNKANYFNSFDSSKYVFWRYMTDGSTWSVWGNSTMMEFKDPQTTITVQAWTRCGLVEAFTFKVVLYVHNSRSICNSFDDMWFQVPTNALVSNTTSTMCVFPDSDFAPVGFTYSSDIGTERSQGKLTSRVSDVKCVIKVAEAGTNFSAVTGANLAISGINATADFKLLEYFGVELINTPTTVAITQVRAECNFTSHFFGESGTTNDKVDSCGNTFAVVDCEPPYVEDKDKPSVCDAGKCLATGKTSLHGPYEACGGNVFTTYDNAKTELKTWNTCCTDCSSKLSLQCESFLGLPVAPTSDMKRCQPKNTTSSVLMADPFDALEQD